MKAANGVQQAVEEEPTVVIRAVDPARGYQVRKISPGGVDITIVKPVRLVGSVHRWGHIQQVQPCIRILITRQLEVAADLAFAMTGLLRLQLDHPQMVVPQDGIIGRTARFVLMPGWQLELVYEDRFITWPRIAEGQPVQFPQERQTVG